MKREIIFFMMPLKLRCPTIIPWLSLFVCAYSNSTKGALITVHIILGMPHHCTQVIPLSLQFCQGDTALHKGEIMTLIVPELSLFVCVVLFGEHHSRTDVDCHRLTELQVGNIGPPVGQLQRYIYICRTVLQLSFNFL